MTDLRRPDWEDRLLSVVGENMRRPHEWGRWDCLLMPAAVVKAVTGKDHGRGHRRRYRSMATAYRHLQGLGFANPEALLDSLFAEKPIGFAQRGDLVLAEVPAIAAENGLEIPPAEVPGVCMGDFALVVGAEGSREGLVKVPRAHWLKAWAIGDHHSGKLKKPHRRRRRTSPNGRPRSAVPQPSREAAAD